MDSKTNQKLIISPNSAFSKVNKKKRVYENISDKNVEIFTDTENKKNKDIKIINDSPKKNTISDKDEDIQNVNNNPHANLIIEKKEVILEEKENKKNESIQTVDKTTNSSSIIMIPIISFMAIISKFSSIIQSYTFGSK